MWCLFGTGVVQGEVLYFDDITTGGSAPVPNGYGGFDWLRLDYQFKVIRGGDYPGTGFEQCVISGDYCAYGRTSDVLRPDDQAFNFEGAYFAAYNSSSLTLSVLGYRHGQQLHSRMITISNTEAVWIDFDFSGIDHLRFVPAPDDYFAMDNFTFSLAGVIEPPRGEVTVDYEDVYLTGSIGTELPLNYGWIQWDNNIWPISESNYQNEYGVSYSMPHSGDKYVFNQGLGYAPIGFSFDPETYPEARLLGAWFAKASDNPAEQVQFKGLDAAGNVLYETDWLTLENEPAFLDAVDAQSGYKFGMAARLEVHYQPEDYAKFSMDDVLFLSDPPVIPIANAGGPYVAQATNWYTPITLNGSLSQDPCDNPLVSYEWDLNLNYDSDGNGDPTDDVDATGVEVSAVFPIEQSSISLVVTDVYGQRSEPDVTTVTISASEVEVNIRPGSEDNVVILHSRGVLPVAFKTDETFDAATIDPTTITLSGLDFEDGLVKVVGRRKQRILARLRDVDDDGDEDLLVWLDIRKLSGHDLDVVCKLGALTYDGFVITGSDTIRIIQR